MNRSFKFIKSKIRMNKFFTMGIFLIVIGVVISVPMIFATLQPVKSIVIFSSKTNYSSKQEGSWKVTNSAEFISSNTALVTMDLDTIAKGSSKYKDVVFLIDMSESMTDERLSILKSGVVASIENILKDTNNKVGIISFNSSSTLVSNLSNSKSTLVSKVNSLNKGTGTSYYQALKQVVSMLKSYTNSSSREFNVVLITDGAPSKDGPNDVALYKYLKDAYPFINISGVQYDAGDKLLDEIKSVSDKQYLTKMDNFNDILSSIVKSSSEYESFTIKEKLNSSNFLVESINDIKVDYGSVSLNNNLVTWNLNNIGSGSKAKMTLKAKLKNTSNGVYELNNNVEVNSTIGGWNDALTSLETPVLSNNYKVKYDGNKPSDCTISGVPTEATHKVFETVSIADSPKCTGYQFKGWDIVTDNVTKVNDDYFIMPEADVTLKANWSKINIRKSTDGKLKESLTLYKQVEEDVSESSKYAKKYTGDTSTFNGDKNVYYYYGEAANNNVLFANYCWKIVRTTDTGGVKLLYNGVPSNGTCNNTGDASVLTASQMGTSSNQVAFNTNSDSLADVGYMYNSRYEQITIATENDFYLWNTIFSPGGIFYGDSYIWDGSKYILNNPVEYGNSESSKNLVGKYTCKSYSSSESCSELKYIIYSHDPTSYDNHRYVYYITLKDGKGITDPGYEETITLSDTIVNNGDGTYTLNNPEIVEKKNFNQFKYEKYYTCGSNEITCKRNNMYYVYDIINFGTSEKVWSVSIDQLYKYGNNYTYNNGKYTLVDTVENIPDENHHYTCKNESGECSELYYVNYKHDKLYDARYVGIRLTDGKEINNALDEMLYNDVNKNNSTIKTAIDTWYGNNMIHYTNYLEDTVWCNDRSMSNQSTNGWNPNGGSLSTYFYFNSNNNSSNLTCTNKNDRFTVNSSNGNGALTYPVGLITRQESSLAYSSSNSPLAKGIYYWVLSPHFFSNYADDYGVSANGGGDSDSVSGTHGVSPAVSLRAGIEYKSGDGSRDHPYVIASE